MASHSAADVCLHHFTSMCALQAVPEPSQHLITRQLLGGTLQPSHLGQAINSVRNHCIVYCCVLMQAAPSLRWHLIMRRPLSGALQPPSPLPPLHLAWTLRPWHRFPRLHSATHLAGEFVYLRHSCGVICRCVVQRTAHRQLLGGWVRLDMWDVPP